MSFDPSKDYYQILGVIPTAEIQVIRAAYKALASIYHPDKNSDPEASTRMKDINEAWSVISDPLTRADYDTQRNSKTADDTLFEEEESGFSQKELEEDWKFAKSFYPEIETNESRLKRINWRLAFAYKAFLLESKRYTDANLICSNFENEFLSTYFGKSEKLIDLAKELIFKYRFHDLLKDLNKTVRILGEGSEQIIIDKFKSKISHKIGMSSDRNGAFSILRKYGYSVETNLFRGYIIRSQEKNIQQKVENDEELILFAAEVAANARS